MNHDARHESAEAAARELKGVVKINGIPHAWCATPEGLQLTKVEGQGAESPKSVFNPRANSPFTPTRRHALPATSVGPCESQKERRETSDTVLSDKGLVSTVEKRVRVSVESEAPSGERRRDATSPVPIVKPRIVYPKSPGGTEIKPPPLPAEVSSASSAVGRLPAQPAFPKPPFPWGLGFGGYGLGSESWQSQEVPSVGPSTVYPNIPAWPMTPIPPPPKSPQLVVFRPDAAKCGGTNEVDS